MKRKSFIQGSAAVIGASLLPDLGLANGSKKRAVRIAHLTDIHLKPGKDQEAGTAKAFAHVQNLKPAVDIIVNGGDVIMDALAVDKQKTQEQWDLLKKILKDENSLPIYHVMGNHDIWGWFIKENRPESDRIYGKVWAVEELGMPKRYYSFDRSNWHFIVLDSTQLNPAGGYIAKLDNEQLDWLKQDLSAVSKERFICIISHIPILSICSGLYFNKTEANGDLMIKRNLMHTDFLELNKIFQQYPNIKTCISGHIHMQDEVTYFGIKYYCNGAVCGNWWNGAFNGFAAAYAIMEFYDDGTFTRKMVSYV